MFTRAKLTQCLTEFSKRLSRIMDPTLLPFVAQEVFQSRAFGSNVFQRLHIAGRINLDLMFYFRKNMKLSSYKLENVAQHFLGEGKMDVTYLAMWQAWERKDGRTLGRVAAYCCRDTELPQLLSEKNRAFLLFPNHLLGGTTD